VLVAYKERQQANPRFRFLDFHVVRRLAGLTRGRKKVDPARTDAGDERGGQLVNRELLRAVRRALLRVEGEHDPLFELVVRERPGGEEHEAEEVENREAHLRCEPLALLFERVFEAHFFSSAAGVSLRSYAETPTSQS